MSCSSGQMLGNVGARNELGEDQVAHLHFIKKGRGSERKVTCLKPTIGRSRIEHFVLGYFQHISFTGYFHFSSLRDPHGPASSSCRAVLGVMFWVWPLLAAHLNSLPSAFHVPMPPLMDLGFLGGFISICPIILVCYLPFPAECKLQEIKDFRLFRFLQNPLHPSAWCLGGLQ